MPEAHRDFRGDIELVPGSIHGFRTFVREAGKLKNMGYFYTWDEKNWNEAVHYNINIPLQISRQPYPEPNLHPAPQKDCSCGFYATYDAVSLWHVNYLPMGIWDSIHQTIDRRGLWSLSWHENELGYVEASGRVVLGERGFRAERMRIIDLIPLDPNRANDIADFVDRYRPDNLNHLGVPQ